MKVAFYTNCLSTHQLPLAREVAERVGLENFRYVDAGEASQPYQRVVGNAGIEVLSVLDSRAREWLVESDLLYTGGLRPIGLIECRARKGLRTLYYSERWFKPWHRLPGWLRLAVPRYRKMTARFVRVINENPCVSVMSIGPHAATDFRRLGVHDDKLIPWGYFVEASESTESRRERDPGVLKILWAGRTLRWKRVDDLRRAVARANQIGTGVVEMAAARFDLTVSTGISPAAVRRQMRHHDVFVLSSDAMEGWGAVVSEALEEGMSVLGTFEAGASATLLPTDRLYHAGDWRTLADLLVKESRGELSPCSIGEWTAAKGAGRLLDEVQHG